MEVAYLLVRISVHLIPLVRSLFIQHDWLCLSMNSLKAPNFVTDNATSFGSSGKE